MNIIQPRLTSSFTAKLMQARRILAQFNEAHGPTWSCKVFMDGHFKQKTFKQNN